MKYPKWFPYPSAWLNAILLALLASGAAYIIRTIFYNGIELAIFLESPSLLISCTIGSLLSPIFLIAIVHHFIHRFISAVAPKLHDPELGNLKGCFPSLLSWWEGLWSWTVLAVTTLLILWLGGMTFSSFGLTLDDFASPYISSNEERFYSFLSFMWLILTAYFYHFHYWIEHIFRGKNSARSS